MSLYPVLEREVASYDVRVVDGKALADAVYYWNVPVLAALADFLSISPADAASMAGYYLPDDENAQEDDTSEDLGLQPLPTNFPLPTEEWFEPAIGLIVVREALQMLRMTPDSMAMTTGTTPNQIALVIRDLEMLNQVLLVAQEQKVRFHLAIDI